MGEAIKELMPLLQKVADKLDSSAMYLWKLQLQQVNVKIITMCIDWLLVIIGWFVIYKAIKFFGTVIEKDHYTELTRWGKYAPFPVIGMGIAGFILVIYSVGAILSIETLISLITNPEYWALKEIIRMVK